jgi:hypothetical protein
VHPFAVLAAAYRDEGLLEDAVRVLEEGLAARPTALHARLLLADTLLRLGRPEAARTHLRDARRTAPDDPEVARLLGRLPEEALALPAVAEEPEAGVLFLDGRHAGERLPLQSPMLAALYEAQGDRERAAEMRRALARRPARDGGGARLEALRQGLRDVRAVRVAGADDQDWALLGEEARALADVLGLGAVHALSVVRPAGPAACGFLPGGGLLLIEGGREALPGQMRRRLRDAARDLPLHCTRAPGGRLTAAGPVEKERNR